MEPEQAVEKQERPVLDAIRAILKFKDKATVAEIARYCGYTYKQALDIINANGHMVWRDRKTGHVTKVDPKAVHRKRLVESGNYYFPVTYGAWSVEGYCLRFDGHDELRQRLVETVRVGAFGDSWDQEHVIDTPENRASLEADGLKLWSEDEADERLWVEATRP